MTRLLHALILGVIGAGIIHIAVLMLVPTYTQRDAWSKLSEISNFYTPTRLDATDDQPALVDSIGPLFDAIACRFDLRDGVTRISGDGNVPFWSVSVYDRKGQNIFSFNDRTTDDGVLDFVIATPAQMIDLRNNLPPDFANSIFVEADVGEGIAVIRGFVPDASWKNRIAAYLRDIDCRLH